MGRIWIEEAAELMVEQGAVLVPTRFVVEHLLGMRAGLPDYAFRKLSALAARHAEAMTIAVHYGVKIAAGTDIFVSSPALWGRNGIEASYLAKAGMTNLQPIEAATANGPATLGGQAPRAGLLAAGNDADVITLDADPLDDVSSLGNPEHILGVWKAGVRVK
jgi:imidazolonepropionase-like amidohydrolase